MVSNSERTTTIQIYREAREALRYIQDLTGLSACRIASDLFVYTAGNLAEQVAEIEEAEEEEDLCPHNELSLFCNECQGVYDEP